MNIGVTGSLSSGKSSVVKLLAKKNYKVFSADKIVKSLKSSPKWNNQFTFLNAEKNLKPSWFGIPILLNKKYVKQKKKYLKKLNQNGIETRPIISGNFLNQPSIDLYKLNNENEKFPVAQDIENRGFFIGLHTKKIREREIIKLTNNLLSID